MREKYESLALADLKEIAKSRGIKRRVHDEKSGCCGSNACRR